MISDRAGATFPGEPGDTTQLNAFVDVLETGMAFDAATGLSTNARLGDYAADLVSQQNVLRVGADAQSARVLWAEKNGSQRRCAQARGKAT